MGEMDAAARAQVMSRARWKARESAPRDRHPGRPPGSWPSARARAASASPRSRSTSPSRWPAAGLTVGVLDADIWGFSVPRLLGMEGGVEARKGKMIPLERTGRRRAAQGAVHGVPGRRGPGDHVAGPHAQPGRPAVPRGRRVGRPRLPPDRPPARHRRRADGPGPDAAAHRAAHRHHPAGRRPEGRGAGRRHGPAGLPAGGRRDREHERLHLRARHDATSCSAPAAASGWPPRSACPWSAPSPSIPTSRPAATPARRSRWATASWPRCSPSWPGWSPRRSHR